MDKKERSLPATRVTNKMYDAVLSEARKDHRDIPEQVRVLLDEALTARQSKSSIGQYL